MNYAVIKTGGKQYRVSEGNVIQIDRVAKSDSGKISFDEVLLLVSDGNVKLGKPFITGEKIDGKIVSDIKGDKIRVSKFKSKVRYRRVRGFRASLTTIEIGKIGSSEKKQKSASKSK